MGTEPSSAKAPEGILLRAKEATQARSLPETVKASPTNFGNDAV
jgi:hypothetical protein